MPYIAKEHREALNESIDGLAIAIKCTCNDLPETMAGVLNYSCTRLALALYPQRKYWTLALVVGVFVTVVLEYYRRWCAPYEDEKIKMATCTTRRSTHDLHIASMVGRGKFVSQVRHQGDGRTGCYRRGNAARRHARYPRVPCARA
jgi:hypothetical protein